MALIGVRRALWKPKSSTAVLPGPPVFTFQGGVSGSASTNTITASALPTGTAGANRFVVVVLITFTATSGVVATSALFDGTISGTVIALSGAAAPVGSSGNSSITIVTANIPANSSTNLVVTFNASLSATSRVYAYTTDQTTLASTTPVTSFTIFASGVTAVTNTVTAANSGSVELVAFAGGINGSNSFTASSPTVTNDATFNVTLMGHAYSVAAGTASATVGGFATSGGLLGSAIFR